MLPPFNMGFQEWRGFARFCFLLSYWSQKCLAKARSFLSLRWPQGSPLGILAWAAPLHPQTAALHCVAFALCHCVALVDTAGLHLTLLAVNQQYQPKASSMARRPWMRATPSLPAFRPERPPLRSIHPGASCYARPRRKTPRR